MMVDASEEKNGIHKMQEILNIIYNCKWLFLEIIFFSTSCIYCIIIIWSLALKDHKREALRCDFPFITISSPTLPFCWLAFVLRFSEHISSWAFRATDQGLLQAANNREGWWSDHLHDTHCCCSINLRLTAVLIVCTN